MVIGVADYNLFEGHPGWEFSIKLPLVLTHIRLVFLMSFPFFVKRKEGLWFAAGDFHQSILVFLTLLTVFRYRQLFCKIHVVLMGTISSANTIDEWFRNEFSTESLVLYVAVFVLGYLSEYHVMRVWVALLFYQLIKSGGVHSGESIFLIVRWYLIGDGYIVVCVDSRYLIVGGYCIA